MQSNVLSNRYRRVPIQSTGLAYLSQFLVFKMQIQSYLKTPLTLLTLVLGLNLFSYWARGKAVRCQSLLPLENALKPSAETRPKLRKNPKYAFNQGKRNWLPDWKCRGQAFENQIALNCRKLDDTQFSNHRIENCDLSQADGTGKTILCEASSATNRFSEADKKNLFRYWHVKQNTESTHLGYDLQPAMKGFTGGVSAFSHQEYFNSYGSKITSGSSANHEFDSRVIKSQTGDH